MQTSKNIYRIIIASFLLFVFIAKLTNAVFTYAKTPRSSIILSSDNSEDQDDQIKKQDSKYCADFYQLSGPSLSNLTDCLSYFTICSLHPGYLLGYVDAHYPSVLTPPPNNNLLYINQ